MENKFSSEDI